MDHDFVRIGQLFDSSLLMDRSRRILAPLPQIDRYLIIRVARRRGELLLLPAFASFISAEI
jgi:hypothetical protein